jgi:hypothetical protein
MPANNYLPDVLETTEAERLATGFIFTEGPLWHPGGYWYFVDIRQNKLFRRYCFCNARRRRKGFGERVRWLHLETNNDRQLPTHGPKVFVGLASNTAAKYSDRIGK